jgi:hypothetical protein
LSVDALPETALGKSLFEYSTENAQSMFCRPGEEPSRRIKIGDETFEIARDSITYLSPCNDALEHRELSIGNTSFGRDVVINLSADNDGPPRSLIKLASDYLEHAPSATLEPDTNDLIPFPLVAGRLDYIGLGPNRRALVEYICERSYCEGHTIFQTIGLTYYLPPNALHNWRAWDTRIKDYLTTLLRHP